jgi:peptide/nickel transport system substrate-binding protein
LLSAVDRPAVVETVFGGFSPVAIGPLTADLLADDPGGLPAFDPQAAADLLEQAGWHVERGRRTKAGADLGLRIVVPDWGSHPEVAQLLALAWEELGVTVEVTVAAGFGPLQEAAAAGEYDLIAFNSFGSDPDVLTSFYISAGLFNWSGVEDEALDRLLERGRTSLDDQTRQQVYLEFARRINESALVLPIRDYVSLVVSDRRVRGLHFSPQGWFPYLIDLSLAP